MLGNLNESQIDNVLLSQVIGRLGCTDGKKPYIIPVTYVYDGNYIIGQSNEGRKLGIMRKHADVCFEVDVMSDMANWQSVLVFGKFQELKGKEATKARDYLFDHVLPLMTSSTIHHHEHEVSGSVDDSNRVKSIMYRIEIEEKTGRFEKK